MKRLLIGMAVLIGITLLNFWFYATFKPSDVLLNRVFAYILENPGSDIRPSEGFAYVFYHSFGDFLAVVMMLIIVSLMMRVLKFEPLKWLYRFTLIMFLVFETMQLFMPGNFKWVDIIMYVFAYFIGMRFIAWLDETAVRGYF